MNFTELLQQLCKDKGVSARKMCLENGLNHSAFDNWKRKNQIPFGETIAKLADYFGVTTDYLLGREEKTAEPPLSPRQKELVEMVVALSDDKIEVAKSYLEFLKSQQTQ
jgi:transcriptional regulator with XRE-family HTH domain